MRLKLDAYGRPIPGANPEWEADRAREHRQCVAGLSYALVNWPDLPADRVMSRAYTIAVDAGIVFG